MKPQDILFFIVLAMLLLIQKPRILVVAGLVCFMLAIPLFSSWIFFTAQRLVYYGAAFLLVGSVLLLRKK